MLPRDLDCLLFVFHRQMHPGGPDHDLLVLRIQSRRLSLECLGFDRIGDLTALGGGAREIHDRILAAFDQHLDGQPPGDDLTLVVLGRKG